MRDQEAQNSEEQVDFSWSAISVPHLPIFTVFTVSYRAEPKRCGVTDSAGSPTKACPLDPRPHLYCLLVLCVMRKPSLAAPLLSGKLQWESGSSQMHWCGFSASARTSFSGICKCREQFKLHPQDKERTEAEAKPYVTKQIGDCKNNSSEKSAGITRQRKGGLEAGTAILYF